MELRGVVTSLLEEGWLRAAGPGLEALGGSLMPLVLRLEWITERSSSFTSGLKVVKSSSVREPGGDRQGTRADALISERPRPSPGY